MILEQGTLLIDLVRDGQTVTRSAVKGRRVYTGRDWTCQLVDPASTVHRRRLLVRTLKGYRITIPRDGTGRFTCGGSTLAVEDMAAWGLAKKTKQGYRVTFRKGMSGRVRIGDVTYVLEYGQPVVSGAAPERLQYGHLPLRYRFQPPNSTDIAFLTLVSLILLTQIAIVRTLKDYPIPEITAIRELPRRISRLILEPVAPPPPRVAPRGESVAVEEVPGAEAEGEAEPGEVDVKPEATVTPPVETGVPVSREEIQKRVSGIGVLGVLSGRGTAGRAAPGSGISVLQLDAELQQDLEKVLGEIGGITTSVSMAGTGGEAGFGDSEPGSGLLGIEGRLSATGVSEPVRVSRIGTPGSLASGSPGGSNADGNRGSLAEESIPPERREERSTRTIARVVASHTGSIRYAYNRELRKKPSLRGKIVLTFTISAGGEVTECRIEESAMNWPPLEDSLVKMVKTWKFPAIPRGDVTVSYPLVFFPSM